MLRFACRNLFRRPIRLLLAGSGIAVSVAVWIVLSAFGDGYRQALGGELQRAGMQMMLVPLGCPYDAAARVLQGRSLDISLPADAVDAVRADPDVAVAAPLLMAAMPRPSEGRTDLWVGLDRSALALKPWWRARRGRDWFDATNGVILGAETAAIELREPGDALHCPGIGATFRVEGVLERGGTADDALFFIPLATAQRTFHQEGRVTAVAIRLRDPARIREVAARLQRIPGAQVVTMTEMMGTFLNLVGTVRTLMLALAVVAMSTGVLGIFNTLLAAVVERTRELCLLRALGASRGQVFGLMTLEAAMLGAGGATAGVLLAFAVGHLVESLVKSYVPLPPAGSLVQIGPGLVARTLVLAALAGWVAALYPAWRASRLPPALPSGTP
ncbi:MAG: FtsX-like permease family protein [Verrucomicrobia bacterium]|nr:MAG: FtsX-like permease family protein [Verrucomicrobiota bacterium]